MPLPVLHSYAGYSLYRLTQKEDAESLKSAIFCMALANLADLDFAPGILIGKAGHFHHGISHSFGAAFFCGLAAALTAKAWKKKRFFKTFFISFLAYGSHIVLDFIIHPDEKMPFFWPFFSKPAGICHSLANITQQPHVAKAGWKQFLEIISGPTTIQRLTSEICFIVTMMILFAIYGELKKHSLALRGSKPARTESKTAPSPAAPAAMPAAALQNNLKVSVRGV